MPYQTEFPDFPSSDIPSDIPSDFVDSSWHYDTCPSFTSDARGLVLWVDRAAPDMREVEGIARFGIATVDDYCTGRDVFESDNWTDTLAEINRHPIKEA